jgi:hypothetical protein
MDGYTFIITPTIRDFIRKLLPGAYPANNIFVAYDTKSDFQLYYGKLENYISPALLGIESFYNSFIKHYKTSDQNLLKTIPSMPLCRPYKTSAGNPC